MTTAATDPSEGPTGYHRHSYKSHCDGRRPYARRQDVNRAVKSTERTSLRVGRMGLCRCPHCGAWQMGHSPAPKLPKSAYVCPTVAPNGGPRCG